MDLKEIDLSRDDGYQFNVDLTKEELDWVYAYLQLTVDGSGVGREILSKVCKNVEGLNEAQSSCMRLVMWTASRLLREGVQKIRVTADDGWSTAHRVTYSSDEGCTKPGIREDMKTLGKDDVEAVVVMAKMKSACDCYGEDFTALVHRMGYMSSLDCIRMFHLMNWFLDMRSRDLVMQPKGGDDPVVETLPAIFESILETLETWRGEDQYLERVEHGAYGPVGGDNGESDRSCRVTDSQGSCKDDVTTVFDGETCNPFKVIRDLTDEQVERIKASFIKDTLNSVYGASPTKTVHPDEDCVLPGCDRYGGNDTYLRIRKVLGHKGAFDFCMGNVIKLVDRWEKKGDPAQNLEKLRDYSAQALVEWRLWNEKLS